MFPTKHLIKNLFTAIFIVILSFGYNIPAYPATIDFSPPSKEYVRGLGCKYEIDIEVNATNESSNAADMEIIYNPNEINILDANSGLSGIQVRPGSAYESFVENRTEPSQSKIFLAAVSVNSTLTSKKVFATIPFEPKTGINSTSFQIRIDGVGPEVTFDSNVADTNTSKDLLKSVTNGTYTFADGWCEKEAPKFNFINPKDRDKKVPIDSQVEIEVTDNLSGVDLSTVEFDINGDKYTPNSSEVRYVSSKPNNLGYKFTIKPRNKFFTEDSSTIKATAKDFAGNRGNGQIMFDPPFVCINDPDTTTTIVNPPDVKNTTTTTQVTEVTNETTEVNPTTETKTENTNNQNTTQNNTQSNTQNSTTENLTPNNSSVLTNTNLKGSLLDQLATTPTTNKLISVNNILPYIILAFALWLFIILDLLLVNRHRLVTGFAIDIQTGLPFEFVPVDIYDLTTKELVDRKETKEGGKYIFHLLPGNYEFIIDYNGYRWSEMVIVPEVKPVKKLGQVTLDDYKWQDKVASFYHKLRIGLAKLAPGMLLAGFIISFLNTLILPSIINIAINALYVIIWILVYVMPAIYRKMVKPNLIRMSRDTKNS